MINTSLGHVLDLTGVSKVFETGTQALAPTDLRVESQTFVSFVGPSGCGKSTLLRIMAGLTSPTTGKVDRKQNSTNAPRQPVGFVFQDPTLMPWATVKENVSLPLELYSDSKTQPEVVNDVLAWLGLDNFENAYPRALSGGMRMRVSIARALITQPSLLLLDEPFAALDEFTRARLNEDLLGLWETQKWTGIFVTHSIREAAFLSDRIVVLSQLPGRIIADIAVPFSRPRQANLRHHHAFSDFCADVSATLAEALAEVGP